MVGRVRSSSALKSSPLLADNEGVIVRTTFTGVLFCVLLAGCYTPPSIRRAMAPAYKPANVYLRQPKLPQSIRRVAVLPVPRAGTDANLNSGVDLLGPVFLDEISKQNVADLVSVAPDELRALTGASSWAAGDKLPLDFFRRLSQATGCDAVLFISLTTYQAFPPLRIGWRARLVDCVESHTWWAVDDLFDAGAASVISGAESYARANLNLPNVLLEDTGVLHSPRRFGQYTAYTLAATLPHH